MGICKECNLIMGNSNNGFRFGSESAELLIIRDYPTRQECAKGSGDTTQIRWFIEQLSRYSITDSILAFVSFACFIFF